MWKPTEKAGADNVPYTCRMLIQRPVHAGQKLGTVNQNISSKDRRWYICWKIAQKIEWALPMTDFLQRLFSTRNQGKYIYNNNTIYKYNNDIYYKNLVLHWHHYTHWSFCQGMSPSGGDLIQMVMLSNMGLRAAREKSSRISKTTSIYNIYMHLLLI